MIFNRSKNHKDRVLNHKVDRFRDTFKREKENDES